MSIRRVNSTGRKRITRADARFWVSPDADGMPLFDAALTLDRYGFPPDAVVFVEAYRQTTFMRFSFGVIAGVVPPPVSARRLVNFDTIDGLQFRVKVVSSTIPEGLLLGEGDGIPVSADNGVLGDRVPLLASEPQDIGHEVWRVDFPGEGEPRLYVNKNLGDWKAAASTPIFRSLVYPAALREVLTRIVILDEVLESDDQDDWRAKWLQFACSLPGTPPLPKSTTQTEERNEWIDDAVAAFARHHQLFDAFRHSLSAEGAP